MTIAAQPLAIQARLVFPISSPPRHNCVVTIARDRIVAVGENHSAGPTVDLGDVAILPGLVNPHTHLEFSDLAAPLGRAGMPFPDWITEVVQWKRAAADRLVASPGSEIRHARMAGLHECLALGVTTVGDIVSAQLDDVSWYQLPITWYAFREMLGHSVETRAQQVDQVHRHAEQIAAVAGLRAALSPHAPYTADRELVALASRLSRERLWPVAMHLAESREELQLLSTGSGPMRDMLEQFGALHSAMFPRGGRPRDYLEILDSAHRSLVIHGNYLPRDDWDFLALRAERMAVVYCPRTHRYFGHDPYPLVGMLGRGVRVVLGTDSRASNPDLNLWEELRYVAREHPQVTPAQILRMGTLDAACALGCQEEVGSLEPGKRADLLIMRIDHPRAADPCAALLNGNCTVHSAMCGGRYLDGTNL
jgi:cytosine/adenosine deaminase-related metal-dependent hydrolase